MPTTGKTRENWGNPFKNWCRMVDGKSTFNQRCLEPTKKRHYPRQKKRDLSSIKINVDAKYHSDIFTTPPDFLANQTTHLEQITNVSTNTYNDTNSLPSHSVNITKWFGQLLIPAGVIWFSCLMVLILLLCTVERKLMKRHKIPECDGGTQECENNNGFSVDDQNRSSDFPLPSLGQDNINDSTNSVVTGNVTEQMIGFNEMESPRAGWVTIRAKFVTVDEIRRGDASRGACRFPDDGDYVRVHGIRNGFLVFEKLEQ